MGNFVKHVAGICASLPLPYVVEYENALLIVFDNHPFHLYVMLLVDLT